jgi:hypothetical protein
MKKNELGGACRTYGEEEIHIQGFDGDHMEDLHVGERIILKWMLKKWNGEMQTRLLWLWIGTGGGHLRMR